MYIQSFFDSPIYIFYREAVNVILNNLISVVERSNYFGKIDLIQQINEYQKNNKVVNKTKLN